MKIKIQVKPVYNYHDFATILSANEYNDRKMDEIICQRIEKL